MNSQLFLIINILGALFFALWFLFGRKNKRNPVQLKMREGGGGPSHSKDNKALMDLDPEISQNGPERDVTEALRRLNSIDISKPLDPNEAKALASAVYNRKSSHREKSSLNKKDHSEDKEPSETTDSKGGGFSETSPGFRDLNVMFIYNGHDWDAYKVIGVPPGSSLVRVTEAYQKLIRTMDKDALPFIEAAYRSILESTKRKKVH